jgi:predicted RNA-binding Zn-ribbon protein involved in translation (DUF1610 family)
MTDEPGHNACCSVCGHTIADAADVHRCPACGSYDVAMLRAGADGQNLSVKRRSMASEYDEDPVSIATVNPFRFLLSKPPRGVPRACWERVRSLRHLVLILEFFWFGCMIVPPLLGSVGRGIPWLDRIWYPVVLLSSVSSIVFPRLLKRAVRRLGAEIQGNNLEHCLECGYPLKGLPAEHRCPECGCAYDIAGVRETWRRYFKAQQ